MKTEEEKAAAEGDEEENPSSFFFDYRYASSIFYHLKRVTSNRQASQSINSPISSFSVVECFQVNRSRKSKINIPLLTAFSASMRKEKKRKGFTLIIIKKTSVRHAAKLRRTGRGETSDFYSIPLHDRHEVLAESSSSSTQPHSRLLDFRSNREKCLPRWRDPSLDVVRQMNWMFKEWERKREFLPGLVYEQTRLSIIDQ